MIVAGVRLAPRTSMPRKPPKGEVRAFAQMLDSQAGSASGPDRKWLPSVQQVGGGRNAG